MSQFRRNKTLLNYLAVLFKAYSFALEKLFASWHRQNRLWTNIGAYFQVKCEHIVCNTPEYYEGIPTFFLKRG